MRITLLAAALSGAAASASAQCNWTLLSGSGPSARNAVGLAYDSARQRVVLFGGSSGGGETWEWDGSAWLPRSTSGPPARQACALAYDAARARTVLFGGRTFSELGDTWLWDGTAWAQAPGAGPRGRGYQARAYHSSAQKVVMAGGQAGAPPAILSDWWEWNGSSWTQGPIASAPAGFCVMTYDSTRQRIVALDNGGTREYNGATWTGFGLPPGGSRIWPAFAFDPGLNRTVMVGGAYSGSGAATPAQQAWNGAAWTFIAGAVPSARQFPTMVYDAARARLVMVGGLGQDWSGNT